MSSAPTTPVVVDAGRSEEDDAEHQPAAPAEAAPPLDVVPELLPHIEMPALSFQPPPAAAMATTADQQFTISPFPKKNANGTAQCMAMGCEKNAQGKTKVNNVGPFCRFHYNAWLISTGQIESWTCFCGIKVSVEADRCGQCHRWQQGKRPPVPTGKRQHHDTAAADAAIASETQTTTAAATSDAHATTSSTATNIEISTFRRMNERGRTLCKVAGCTKLDQARNDGYCRKHFRMLSGGAKDNRTGTAAAAAATDNAENSNAVGGGAAALENGLDLLEDWTCSCGKEISAKQKRCGKCNKWRGGKREPYNVAPRVYEQRAVAYEECFAVASERSTEDNNDNDQANVDTSLHWTCPCGSGIPFPKSRCGKCHRWRDGKRKGGWTIKAFKTAGEDDSGIDWTQDWTCCEEVISAKKRRCGKCNGWRGGKRIAKDAVVAPLPEAVDNHIVSLPPLVPMENSTLLPSLEPMDENSVKIDQVGMEAMI